MKENGTFKSDGIVLLNKSKGISSFKAINKLKWIIKSNKVGHAGTLDPIAEGLLIVMVNNATKFSDNLMKKDKEYFVELELGYETATYDTEGEIMEKYESEINISDEKIFEVINSFVGEIMQVPPMYSAIKINGEKLYELARKGIEVERQARKVKIYSIREISIEQNKISFYTEVSSGTYIRSLVRDIGRKLGVYATMTRLVRTKIDKYSIDESVSLEEIEKKLNDEKEIFIYGSRKFYPANFVSCYYNSETKSYEFKENSELFQLAKCEGKEIKIEYKENDFSKDLKDEHYPVNITKEEFDKILKIGNFNNTSNKPAQNLSYCLIDAD